MMASGFYNFHYIAKFIYHNWMVKNYFTFVILMMKLSLDNPEVMDLRYESVQQKNLPSFFTLCQFYLIN